MKLVKSTDGLALELSPVEGRRKRLKDIYQKDCSREEMNVQGLPLGLLIP